MKRQPVILTNEEKEHIDKNHPGSYNRAMKYGSSKSKNFWYICPRYWDLRRNVSLTNEEVDKLKQRDGDIIIPPGAKVFHTANIYLSLKTNIILTHLQETTKIYHQVLLIARKVRAANIASRVVLVRKIL